MAPIIPAQQYQPCDLCPLTTYTWPDQRHTTNAMQLHYTGIQCAARPNPARPTYTIQTCEHQKKRRPGTVEQNDCPATAAAFRNHGGAKRTHAGVELLGGGTWQEKVPGELMWREKLQERSVYWREFLRKVSNWAPLPKKRLVNASRYTAKRDMDLCGFKRKTILTGKVWNIFTGKL